MKTEILMGLSKLDVKNDDHWTSNGSPRMDVVQQLVGNDTLTRKMVTDAAPQFSRENPDLPGFIGDGKGPEADAIHAAAAAEGAKDVKEAGQTVPGETFAETPPEETASAGAETGEVEAQEDEGYILDLSPDVIFRDPIKVQAFIAEMSVIISGMQKEKEQLQAKIVKWSQINEKARNTLQRMQRGRDGDPNQKAIKDYMVTQAKVRAERLERTRKFLEAGVNAREVAQELIHTSRIDQALQARKSQRGSTRPSMPVRGVNAG